MLCEWQDIHWAQLFARTDERLLRYLREYLTTPDAQRHTQLRGLPRMAAGSSEHPKRRHAERRL